ncbi:MAG: cytochrome c biogenesis protein CcsA [Planctomycetota bacterium]|jgi:cytochrome c-type biogenesis protein CcsB
MEQVFTTEGSLLTLELRVFSAVMALYVLSCVLHISQAGISVFFRNFFVGRAATNLLLLAVIGHTIMIIIRGVEQGQPPVQNKYECLSWFAWCNCITYLYIRRRWSDLSMPGIFVTILSIAALFLAVNKYSPAVTPIAPALQSPWYFWHVLIAFGAYAVFVVGCSVELSYLIIKSLGSAKRSWEDFGLPSADVETFHGLTYKLILLGFPLLTFGIISGAAWADQAWGRYWSWDPFEILSMITWTAFGMYLHSMSIPKWRNVWGSTFCLMGFVAMLITFMGSGFLTRLFGLYSMHAY